MTPWPYVEAEATHIYMAPGTSWPLDIYMALVGILDAGCSGDS